MKMMGTIVAVLLIVAVSANAAITDSSVKLQINTATGQAYIVNAGPDVINLVGYYIMNATGKATMTAADFNPTSWNTVQLQYWVGGGGYLVAQGLCSNWGKWSPIAATSSYIGEAITDAGTYSAFVVGGKIGIGHITSSTVQSDFSTTDAFKWQYFTTSIQTMTNNTIEFVPEPATMSLLVIGGIATLIRRRR